MKLLKLVFKVLKVIFNSVKMSEVVRTNLSPLDYLREKQRNTWNIQNEENANSLMSNPFTEWFKREKERRKIERIKNKN